MTAFDAPAEAIRPGKIWYFVSLAILVVGVMAAGWKIRSHEPIKSAFNVVPIRDGSVTLGEPGEYALFVFKSGSTRMDPDANRQWQNAAEVDISIRQAGAAEDVDLTRTNEVQGSNNNSIAMLAQFEAPAAGEYSVEITTSLSRLRPSLYRGSMDDFLASMVAFAKNLVIGIGIGVVSVLLALIVFLYALLRRGRAKRRLQEAARHGYAPPVA